MPLPRVVYFMDEQLDDNLQECCRPKSMSILSIDTTFNVGDFYMTTTTYQSEKVVRKLVARKLVKLPTCLVLRCFIQPKLRGITFTSPTPFWKVITILKKLLFWVGTGTRLNPSFSNHQRAALLSHVQNMSRMI